MSSAPAVDMSPAAVERRIRDVSQLLELWWSLKKARILGPVAGDGAAAGDGGVGGREREGDSTVGLEILK